MNNIGLKECIAESESEYIQICINLSSALKDLACLRAEIRGKLIASPIMNELKFVKEMEDCYKKIIDKHFKDLSLKNNDNKKK